MSKREIAIKATRMCLSFLSLMGSSKTKAELLNCDAEAKGSWSHVQEQFRVVAPALAHGKCTGWATLWSSYLFVFDVTLLQGRCWVCFWGPNKMHSLVQGNTIPQPGPLAPGSSSSLPNSLGKPYSAGDGKKYPPPLLARQANLSRTDLVSF